MTGYHCQVTGGVSTAVHVDDDGSVKGKTNLCMQFEAVFFYFSDFFI